MNPRNPKNRAEWQEAVDAAYACLALESARAYGLVRGGPRVNSARALDLLRQGKQLCITPSGVAIERFIERLPR